jgi:catechol 2,3-dioxygenase-like lactoylglutathione lyase family enzyme
MTEEAEVAVLEVEAIHHVSLAVTDLEAARRFWGGVLGLREIPRPEFPFPGAWYEVGGRQVHLIVHGAGRTLRHTRDVDSHDGHVALRVRSYAGAKAHLAAQGVAVRDRYENHTPWAQLYVTDPDGNVVELNAEREGAGP